MKLMIGIPILDNVQWKFFLYTSTLIGKLSKKHEVGLTFPNRCAIDRARQMCVLDAIGAGFDRLLFIDDDTLVPFDCVDKLEALLQSHPDAISASGFCYQRGYSYMPMVYQYPDYVWASGSCQLIEPWPSEPFRVSANGMGVCLLDVAKLAEIEKQDSPVFGRNGIETEDFYFYHKADKAGFTSWCDPSVEAKHLGDQVLVSSENASELRSRDHVAIYRIQNEPTGRGTKGCGTVG